MKIHYDLYKVFYYVASTLSFSEAASKLCITQSAVSQSIKILEKKIQRPLFIRSTKRVQLTPEGEILLRHLEPAINLLKRAELNILESKTNGGQIRIGASDTICRYFLVPYLEKFHKDFPNVHISIVNATSVCCTELLEAGKVDIIIINLPNKYISNNVAMKEIYTFEDVFIANENFQELREKKISLRQLLKYPIMMLENKSTTSEFLHNILQQENLDFIPEIELTSNDLLKDFAKIGLGLAFVPNYCLTETDLKTLFVIKTKKKIPERKLGLVYNDKIPVSRNIREFLKYFE